MAGGFPRTLWRGMGRVGEATWARWDQLIDTAAVLGTVLLVSVQPRSWVRPVRRAFVHQIVVLGVESVAFVSGVAVFVGITIVVHLVFWIGLAGQSQLLGPLLVTIVVRELAPVLVSLIMIVRSGSAMATELGIMKIDGRVLSRASSGSWAWRATRTSTSRAAPARRYPGEVLPSPASPCRPRSKQPSTRSAGRFCRCWRRSMPA